VTAYYSKRHYERVSPRADTDEAIAERISHRAACERAVREREDRFPVLTPENAVEAIAWQTARITELLRGSP
jgi:hypothetical protein